MRQLILFISKYRNTLLLIVFVLFAFIRHSFKNPVAEHAINSVGFGTIGTIQNTLSGWSYYWDLDEVNAELARENAMLHSGLTSKSGPDFSASGAYDFIPARVIEYSYTKASNYITVDAGKAEGIEKGMGVISSSGWVGTVSDLSTNYAAITPLIHARGTIGARIKDKGLGELRWSGANFRKAQLFDIQREHQPMPGDSVYSYTRASVAPPM
ncbi:MAG: hypothetical protein RLZZ599_540, partial [Bacteroidota bacterium]